MKSIDQYFDVRKELGLEDLPNEIWKDIPDFEGLYQVSNLGRIKSLDRLMLNPSKFTKNPLRKLKGRILKIRVDKHGYCTVTLYSEGTPKLCKIHRLVAQVFIHNSTPETRTQIDHIDGNKINNTVLNLKWVTSQENANNPITFVNRTLQGRERNTFCRRHVINLSTGKNFNSIREAARFYKLSAKSLGQNIKKNCIYGGYEWAFA